MADDKKKKDGEEEPKKSKKKLFIIGGAALVLAAGAGVGVAVMMGGGGKEAQASEVAKAEESVATESETLISLETFVANLADPKGDRFIKVTMRGVFSDEAQANRIISDDLVKSRVRDRFITVLSSKTFADVSSPIGKESLRRELVRELNKALGAEVTREILFIEFVVQ